jgi:glycogen debranching enzyme
MPATAPRLKNYGSLLEECYGRSLDLLRRNATPHGILAATPTERAAGRRYASVFGRDAAICALGMIASGESDLVEAARAGLRTLACNQAPNGQIPKYVRPETGEVDFWYSGCIDATLWWLAAVRVHDRLDSSCNLGGELEVQVGRALDWLSCQEHQVWRLLQQNEASDWADIMPRSGFVLYTNALWYWVKRLYDLPGTAATRDFANYLLFPFGNAVPEHRRARLLVHYIRNKAPRSDFYLSFVNFSFWGEEVDLFGNLLAALTGLADPSRGIGIVKALKSLGASRPHPIRVVGRPIAPDSPLWRSYMGRHRQNLPFQYHNGGIWPFVGGAWVMLLARLGLEREAWEELERLAAVNRVNCWEFNEWFHGRSGEPMGMPGQSWNAALFILAYRALADGFRLLG